MTRLLIIAACAALAADTQPPLPRYAVILTAWNGQDYAVDTGMTLDDCSAAIAAEWQGAFCVKEPE